MIDPPFLFYVFQPETRTVVDIWRAAFIVCFVSSARPLDNSPQVLPVIKTKK